MFAQSWTVVLLVVMLLLLTIVSMLGGSMNLRENFFQVVPATEGFHQQTPAQNHHSKDEEKRRGQEQ
jgi:hypothetical protein